MDEQDDERVTAANEDEQEDLGKVKSKTVCYQDDGMFFALLQIWTETFTHNTLTKKEVQINNLRKPFHLLIHKFSLLH